MSADNERCTSENIMETLSLLEIAETDDKTAGKFSFEMEMKQ